MSDAVGAAALAWAVRSGLCSAALATSVQAVGVVDLARAMYPAVSEAWLALATKWTIWSFVADDELDTYYSESAAAARVVELKEYRGGGLGQSLGALACGFSALSPSHAARFRTHVDDFLDGCVSEARHRERGVCPTIAEYRAMRPSTGAMWVFISIALASANVSAQEEGNVEVRQLLAMAAWLPCVANDLVSVTKELHAGDVHNAVIVRMRATGATLEAARDAVAAEYCCESEAFESAMSSNRVLSPDAKRALTAVVQGPRSWLAESGRYRT